MHLCVPVITCIPPVKLINYLHTLQAAMTMSNSHAIHSKIKTKHHADKCFIHITYEIEIYGTPDNTCPNYEGKLNMKTFFLVKCTVCTG